MRTLKRFIRTLKTLKCLNYEQQSGPFTVNSKKLPTVRVGHCFRQTCRWNINNFCDQMFASAARTYMGRFKGKDGLLFHSNSYTRLNRNLSNCMVWTKKSNFFFVETFVSLPSLSLSAIVRKYKNVEVLRGTSSFPTDQTMNPLYQLSNTKNLEAPGKHLVNVC